ncbi:hypothetical protein Tco_0436394 [Tanacetum coccineum]
MASEAKRYLDKSSEGSGEEDSEMTGKVTSAGMYFLHFQVYQMDSTANAITMAKNPVAAFFTRLEDKKRRFNAEFALSFLARDNFFDVASYTIEAICATTYEDTTHKLKDIEQQILRKRTELRQFETEYRQVKKLGVYPVEVRVQGS